MCVCYPAGLISGDEDGVSTFQEDEHGRERYRGEQKDSERKKTKRESRKRNASVGQEMELWEKPEKTGKAKRGKEKKHGEAEKTRSDVGKKQEEMKCVMDSKRKKNVKNENQLKVQLEEGDPEENHVKEKGKHVVARKEDKKVGSKIKEKSEKVKKKRHNKTAETR